jgi:hypothetical protein
MKEGYFIIAAIVGFLTFLAIWFFAIIEWGLLMGLMAGWIPAMIGGALFGLIWPLTLLGFLWVISLISHG